MLDRNPGCSLNLWDYTQRLFQEEAVGICSIDCQKCSYIATTTLLDFFKPLEAPICESGGHRYMLQIVDRNRNH